MYIHGDLRIAVFWVEHVTDTGVEALVNLEKGTVLGWNWYYVVVGCTPTGVNCICDNANNIYYFEFSELSEEHPHKWLIMSPKKAMLIHGWGRRDLLSEEEEIIFNTINREIPVEVIAEVLSGVHDDRFEHLGKRWQTLAKQSLSLKRIIGPLV